MQQFIDLYRQLVDARSTPARADALKQYFGAASPEDAAWAVSLLSGQAPRRVVSARELRAWTAEAAGVPDWLVQRCYTASGDLSETAALLVEGSMQPNAGVSGDMGEAPLAWWLEQFVPQLPGRSEQERKAEVLAAWRALNTPGRLLLNKLLTGSLRLPASRSVVERALAEFAQLPRAIIAQRLAASFEATRESYNRLIAPYDEQLSGDGCDGLPYPFALISPGTIDELRAGGSNPGEWLATYDLDNAVRAQLVRHAGCTALWSSAHKHLTPHGGKSASLADWLPDGTILEGSILGFKAESPGESIGRFVADDLLQLRGTDLRSRPFSERRILLEGLLASELPEPAIALAQPLTFQDWDQLQSLAGECRATNAAGLLLRRNDSVDDSWHALLRSTLSIKAVLLYAEAARGQAASRFTNFTFGVWAAPGGERTLVPIAKTAEGLTNSDRRRVDAYILKHTLERHGPVRVVQPTLVGLLEFDAVDESPRHKSGLTLRGAHFARLLPDVPVEDADTLGRVRELRGGAGQSAQGG